MGTGSRFASEARRARFYDNLVMELQEIPTKVIAAATGYNPRTVRRLKRGEFRPSAEKLKALRKTHRPHT